VWDGPTVSDTSDIPSFTCIRGLLAPISQASANRLKTTRIAAPYNTLSRGPAL
jgi:hypothetical protein